MRTVLAAVILALAIPQAAEANIRVRIQANVAASCGVADVAVLDGRLTVLTVCNAERFQLIVRTAEGPVTVLAANSPDAVVHVGADALAVTNRAPGAQRFVVQTDATGLTADMVTVEAVLV